MPQTKLAKGFLTLYRMLRQKNFLQCKAKTKKFTLMNFQDTRFLSKSSIFDIEKAISVAKINIGKKYLQKERLY